MSELLDFPVIFSCFSHFIVMYTHLGWINNLATVPFANCSLFRMICKASLILEHFALNFFSMDILAYAV